ncbi:MAG: JAB domain-containing protein [Bacteroidota bacterium]
MKKSSPQDMVLTAEDISMICETMFTISKHPYELREKKDRLLCIALNQDHEPLNIELVHTGPINVDTIRPPDILRVPLAKEAANVVLVHETPGDDISLSMPEGPFLFWLMQACLIMKTPLLEYLVIGGEHYFSFKESGLMDEWTDGNPYNELFTSED